MCAATPARRPLAAARPGGIATGPREPHSLSHAPRKDHRSTRRGGSVGLPGFDFGDSFSYSGALSRALDKGVSVTLY